jgi:hypothetical protein
LLSDEAQRDKAERLDEMGTRLWLPWQYYAVQNAARRIGHPGKPTSQILAPNDVGAPITKGSSGPVTGSTAIR